MTKSAIEGIEKGETRHISAEIFEAMAAMYAVDYHALVRRYVQSEYGFTNRDLIRHDRTGGLPPQQKGGGVDDSTAREIADLRQELERYKAFVGTATDAAGLLARAVAALEKEKKTARESHPPRRPERPRNRPHRKAS